MYFPGHVSISRCENRYGPWLNSKEPSRYEYNSTLLTGPLTHSMRGGDLRIRPGQGYIEAHSSALGVVE